MTIQPHDMMELGADSHLYIDGRYIVYVAMLDGLPHAHKMTISQALRLGIKLMQLCGDILPDKPK